MRDFTHMSTQSLAADTLRRAKDVGEINNAAWDSVIPALISSIPFCIAASLALVEFLSPPHSTRILYPAATAAILLATVGIAAPFVIKWHRRIRACRAFTKEMNGRTTELQKRNQTLQG